MLNKQDNGFEGIALEYHQMMALDTKRMADAVEKIAELLLSIDQKLGREDTTEREIHLGDFPKNAQPGDTWSPTH